MRLVEQAAAGATAAGREADALFRELRMTPLEPLALAALDTASSTHALGETMATAAAKACMDRGELEAARRFLRHTTGPDALLLAADLAEEAGEAPAALALVERVLARAIDHPGARERHARLALSLGRRVPAFAHNAGSSTAASSDGTVVSAHVDSPYEMRRELARGGAAAVYEAEDRDLQRRVALKVYHDPQNGRDQLLHEARVATELAAPGVIRVYDVDVRGGWLVLEYFEHGSLREWLRHRPDEIARWAWLPSLITTLADIHARGYAHLDVKPGNVLLRSASESILADFGTARHLGEPSPPGSLGYVSPERLGGAAASALDDVYGVGRIIQEVLAVTDGDAPDSPERMHYARLAQTLTAHAAGRPQLRAIRPR